MFRPELDYDDTKGVEEGEEDVAERWVRVGYGGKMWLKGGLWWVMVGRCG